MNSISLDERMGLDRDATMSRFVEAFALLLKIRRELESIRYCVISRPSNRLCIEHV